MKLSVGQISVGTRKDENLAAIERATVQAASDGASMIVFPEYAMWVQKTLDQSFIDAGEVIPGQFTTALDSLAKRHGIAIVAGMMEAVTGTARVYNTLYATSDTGSTLATYRKVHLYDAFGLKESEFIAPADAMLPVVIEVEDMRVGLMTCYDLRFPESARVLVDAGAQVLLCPAAWSPGVRKEDHWETLVRARAIENTSYVVAANVAAPFSTGGSMVADPMGLVVAQLGDRPETRTVELFAERVRDVRTVNPSLANRRYRVSPAAPKAWQGSHAA